MFTTTSLFPDVNVWVALVHGIHPHHRAARAWGESLENDCVVYLCRFTQLGLLRLLTNESAMRNEVMTQAEAWKVYDSVVQNPVNRMMDEPLGIESSFRGRTDRHEASTKQWADGYLAAFAETGGLRLVTFDKALAAASKGSVLLS